MVCLQVDNGLARLAKNPQLGGKVILPGGVLQGGDVVAADVQEGRHVQVQADDAVVLEGLAGDLHDQVVQVAVARVGDVAPQVAGLGRGVDALRALDAVEGLDGADDGRGWGGRGRGCGGASFVRVICQCAASLRGVQNRAQNIAGG